MSRTKKKKNHIFFYDPELKKMLNAIKKAENLTWDELLKTFIKIKDTDELIRLRYNEAEEKLVEKYKNEELKYLMELYWVHIIKSAHGEYDIKRLISDIEKDLKWKTYLKEK